MKYSVGRSRFSLDVDDSSPSELRRDWMLYLSGKIEQFNLTKVKTNSEKLNWLEMEREHIW